MLTDSDDQRDDASALPGGAQGVVEDVTLATISENAATRWSSFSVTPLPSRVHLQALLSGFFTRFDWFMMVFGSSQSNNEANLSRPYLKRFSEPVVIVFSTHNWSFEAKKTLRGS